MPTAPGARQRTRLARKPRVEFPREISADGHTNLLGTIRVIDAFTPHLIAQGSGTIITVTSGIGFLPFPVMPTYAASKAGVHAYSEALRAQLDGTGAEVAELIPPAVATTPEHAQSNPARSSWPSSPPR